jgi:hypothetical protein
MFYKEDLEVEKKIVKYLTHYLQMQGKNVFLIITT